MTMHEQYESKTGERALYRKDGADYHTLRYVRWLESRLAEEIKWGHRNCTHDNCESSGTDCPANSVICATHDGGGKDGGRCTT